MKLKLCFTNEAAKIMYANREKPLDWKKGDSGIDLSYFDELNRKCTLGIGATATVSTGVKANISETNSDKYEIQIRGRSGLNAKGILVHIGTVDYSYTGELKVNITNLSRSDFTMTPGDRIAQIVVAPIAKPQVEIVDNFEDVKTDRGEKGFGSSGMK